MTPSHRFLAGVLILAMTPVVRGATQPLAGTPAAAHGQESVDAPRTSPTDGAIGSFAAPAVATKPTVTTGVASSITETTATIAGSVNANGADTHRVVDYGTSSTLAGARKTMSVDIGAGTSVIRVSVPLSGLAPKTKYYYRVQATNSAGNADGAIKSFTTLDKPTATTEGASSITARTATIAASVNANGADTHFVFAYGTSNKLSGAKTTSVDIGASTTAVAVSAKLTGLIANTKYYYQVQATNRVGTANGAIDSFTTLATLPTVTTRGASTPTGTSVAVFGTVNPHGTVAHTDFAYGTSSTLSGASRTTSQDAGSGTTAGEVNQYLTGLTPATKYYFQLQATNSAGTAKGAIESFTTGSATRPTVTTGAASSVTKTTATVTGSVNPQNADTHCLVAYGTSSTLSGASKTTSEYAGALPDDADLTVVLTGLTPGTVYYYRIQATNVEGTASGAIKSFTTAPAPALPATTTGTASSITSTTATVSGSVNPNGLDTQMVFTYGTSSTLSGASKTTSADIGSGTTAVSESANLTGLTAGTKYYYQLQATSSAGTAKGAINSFTTSPPATPGYGFLTVAPCRVADTRNADGPFGGPALAAGTSRELDIPQSACGIPSTAVAYSLNVTVVPSGSLDHLTLWPTGEAQPDDFTLSSPDGRVKAVAAIVAAGTDGGVTVYASDATDVLLDINGYFVPENTAGALAFFPLAPCNVVDTYDSIGSPFLAAGSSRDFPVLSSSCSIPSTAQAYSLNVTAQPHTSLESLTVWPTGQMYPGVDTLSAPTGTVVANAAIVAAGASGQVSALASDDTDLNLDINGYFAPPGPGGLALHIITPCRVLDTRPDAFTDDLVVDVQGSACAPPADAKAYVVNATALPQMAAGFLYLWPDGASLNAGIPTLYTEDGAVTSNMAIVGTSNGKIHAYAYDDPTNLVLDSSGYFATCAMCTTAGWSGQVQCVKTVTGPSYANNETQTWTVLPGISQQPTGQTLYPTLWVSTGSGQSASQTWVIHASGAGRMAVIGNGSGVTFARNNSEIAVPNGYQATPPPSNTDYEYQWLPFGSSDPNATHVQGGSTTTSPTCDSPNEPGGSSCTVTCSWNFNKQ